MDDGSTVSDTKNGDLLVNRPRLWLGGGYGLNLVLAMLRRGVRPRLLQKPGEMDLDPLQARMMPRVLVNFGGSIYNS
ncbi:MAG: hypothetical protein HQL84_02540 [Magnetococcales bacterium]|nr:hypothetical protein [Magnetococcales bacterium]MBF0148904.1 hypothetical protein [Magnetococcales bacterium]MBF0347608.1 hypothetical protein [Magnetococcales bacterium]